MSDAAAPTVVRLRIPCADQREFLERFAPRYARGGVFVPGGRLRPVGTRIHLKLEFRDGTVGVSGDALVTGQGTPEKPGMVLRFTSLHTGSIQFELSPVGGPGPALTPAPGVVARAPDPAARGELADELFGPDVLEDEPIGSAKPLEVRTGKVKLKLKETPREQPAAAGPSPGAEPEAPPARREPPPEVEPTPARPLPEPAAGAARTTRLGLAVATLGLGVMVAVGLAVAGTFASRSSANRAEALEAELKTADARMRELQLTRPAGDSALDHLLAARALAPTDARVVSSLKALADTFELLGTRAAARGDLREAAVHLEAAVKADPDRAQAARRLGEVKARLAGATPQTR